MQIFRALILTLLIAANCNMAYANRNQRKSPYRVHKKVVANNEKRYKQMKACEEKFMKRFAKVYASQHRKIYETDTMSSPFFSTSNVRK